MLIRKKNSAYFTYKYNYKKIIKSKEFFKIIKI